MAVKAAVGRAPVRGHSRLRIGARRSGGGAVGGGDAEAPFYRVGGGAGWPGDRGEQVAVGVHHNGGGGGRFGRGSVGAVVGMMRGVLRPFWEQKGGAGRWRAHAREAMVAASVIRPGEEDDQAGPVCQRERAGRAGQRPRPSGGWQRRPNRRRKGSGPKGVEGEAGHGWAESGAKPEFKKNSFRISIDFRIWQNFGKLYKEI
jgi:hypothetical protein